ncbi:MAG: succinate dehydrogenase, hydrophobic membrane anchor protein [Gammaproteobacteria bacterium]|nr:succinate dehydrogenase, hydrophobic membrane anchor protein [Gammaproteobacteria bacterium]MBT8104699.1 succinate dehydrogenase, hydrophobic membrane anchor protein [Gammaproteobacteria bacterium]NNF48906.1 succinate dehydrogenase, hydrophobic membrane anchor protein [Woeseiaceae bacterium]NNK24713.1 succinate dehydrogenase, hydrophobic membrane anchor protein [Woeseiaceae bacterium]NNL62428.1 succinate dehydrogenase, hydrophobic membrane anchor protein [Woeseiaceae bacterium]
MSLRSPLGRVLGLGTAKDGTSHWWGQRVSGAALAILGLWFAVAIAGMPGYAHADAAAFIGEPLHAVLLMLLTVTMAYHSYLGVQVVIEDYVHGHGLKIASLVLSRFAHVFLAVVGLYAILRLGIGA